MRQPVHCWFTARAIPVPREAADAVEACQPVGIEGRADGLSCGVQRGEFGGKLLLARGYAGADAFHLGGKQLHLGAGLGQRGFLRLGALQAGVLLIFQPLGFGGFEMDFVLDGRGLLGCGDRVELGAEFGGFLAVPSISRSRRVRSVSSRLSAAEASADWRSAAASRACDWAISAGSARSSWLRRARSRSMDWSFTRFSMRTCISELKCRTRRDREQGSEETGNEGTKGLYDARTAGLRGCQAPLTPLVSSATSRIQLNRS